MKKRLNSNFAYMKPRSLALLTLMTLLLLLLTQSALAQSDAICNPFDGDIDDDNDRLIEICHLEDLDAIRYQLDGTGYTASTGAMKIIAGCPDAGCNGYELSRDLDFLEDTSYRDAAANKASYTQGTGWRPIGRFSNNFRLNAPFIATFNGNRYTLSNLRIDRPGTDQVALFGYVDGGRIMNVALLNVRIRGLLWVGGLVGGANRASITGSYATEGSVEGTDQRGSRLGVGALIGEFVGTNTISSNYANLRVTAHFASGGLIGFINGVGSGSLTISNNYAVGSIAADSFVGGFVSVIRERDFILRSSSNYASGVVTGKENVGGFIGSITGSKENIHFTDNYWDIERSRQRSSVGEEVGQISSLTTVQMTVPTAPGTTVTEAYHNWSEAHWDFGSRYDYPVLRHTTANSALGQKVGDLLGHQRPAAKLNRLLLRVGERTLPLSVEQAVHRQLVDFDIEQISLSAESDDGEAILHINGMIATSGEMRSFDLPVAQTTTLTLTLSQPYYVWPRVYALEVYRKANAELSELNVSAGQLMPSFNPQTTFYTLSVSATTETLIVTPVAADPKVRIEVDGGVAGREIALREGTTTISILVAARDRIAQTTYTLAVWRPTSDARLQALSVPNGVLQPKFTAEQTTYTAAVFGADRIQLVARAPRGATIEVNGVQVASGQPSAAIEVMSDIPTRIVVMVTAGDGVTTKRYVVWATRQVGMEAQLATLSLPSIALTPPFKPGSEQRTYTATVIGISEVVLTASAALGGMLEKIAVNGTPISVNRNGEYAISLLRMGAQPATTHIVITVESEDQSTQTHYRVAIQRQPSSDAQLTVLSLADGTQAVPLSPSFSSTRTAYTATAVGTRTITLTATASRHAKFTVNGVATASGQPSPIALSPSTTTNITLIVTAEDTTTTMSYTVAVAHQPSNEAQLTALSLSDGTQAVPLSPPFSATQTTYTATLAGQISAITLTATVSRHATLTVNGVPTASGQPSHPIALSPSTTTTITLIVSAEDAITTTAYTLQIITTARPTAALRVRSRIFLEAPLP